MIVARVTLSLWRPLKAALFLPSSSTGRFVAGWGKHTSTVRSYSGCPGMSSYEAGWGRHIPTVQSYTRCLAMGPCEADWGRHVVSGRGYSGAGARGGQDERLLEPLIGRWLEISCQGFQEFLDASGIPQDQQAFLRSIKAELIYSKQNSHWKIESGYHNMDNMVTYTFQIGKKFTVLMPGGVLFEGIVTQDGAKWMENYKSVTNPHSIMTVTNEVKGDKMNSVSFLCGCVNSTVNGWLFSVHMSTSDCCVKAF
ncbi:hypothetical protein BsWGS_25201 [Bradybaena similaris]